MTIRVFLSKQHTTEVICDRVEDTVEEGYRAIALYTGSVRVAFFDTFYGWQGVTTLPTVDKLGPNSADIFHRL